MIVELYLISIGWVVLIAWWLDQWVIRATIRKREQRALEAGPRGDPSFWWGVSLRRRLGRMPTLRELATGPTSAEKAHYIVHGRWPGQEPEPATSPAFHLDPDELAEGGRPDPQHEQHE